MVSADVADTIAAIASAPGSGLRGIIRISGPRTVECLAGIFHSKHAGSADLASLKSTVVIPGSLQLPEDHALPGKLLFWPTRRSYTRQPTAEFHTFGSPPLLNLALERICSHGARLAEPGEFTLRAFLAGRIDLTQAEAVLAVIDSRGQEQLKTALRQLAGGLTGPLDEIRNQLIGLLAELEAGLDFVEEDIEFITTDELTRQLASINDHLMLINQQIQARDVDRSEFRVALIGPPNVGKSSLFNSLLGKSATIVADVEGTTRDFVSGTLHLENADVQLIDTAGLERGHDPESPPDPESISGQAQRKTSEQYRDADLRLICISADHVLSDHARDAVTACSSQDIIVVTKSDLVENPGRLQLQLRQKIQVENDIVCSSCQTGLGVERLKRLIADSAADLACSRQGIVSSTVSRAKDSLSAAAMSVELALQAVRDDWGLEIVAAECRGALDELGRVVGKIYTDDILDQVFGRFCIGK